MMAHTLNTGWQDALAGLDEGWDGDGALPISPEAIATVQSFSVVPLSDGGVQLEFHRDGFDVEIEVAPQGKVTSVLVIAET